MSPDATRTPGRGAPSALATLREPSVEEASRWHKPRKNPPAVRMKTIVDVLMEDPTVRVVKRTDASAELVIDTGAGTTVRITIRPDEIDVRAGLVLLQREGKTASRAAYLDEVSSLVAMLQLGSGFYVFSDELIGFEPSGGCPACGVEVYEWQDECVLCNAKLHPPSPGEDEHDGRSRRVVEVLLRRRMIELVSPRGRRNVERTVSAFYAYGTATSDVLLGIFMDMADIAEVYCDEDDLHQVLFRIR